jgi:undecaprenyl-diphosphatase
VNAAAREAHAHGIPLLVVPAGTLNHFARDLGIASAEAAADALEGGSVAPVDVGMIDGRPFLNTASFGAYSELVDHRERLEHRLGKWPAAVIALARVLRSAPARVEIDGRPMQVWVAFIGNCGYEPRGFAPSRRHALDDGVFDVRILRAEGRWARLRVLLAALSGDLTRSSAYEEWRCERMEIRSADGPMRLACDGETFDGGERFAVEKAKSPLGVVVPTPSP